MLRGYVDVGGDDDAFPAALDPESDRDAPGVGEECGPEFVDRLQGVRSQLDYSRSRILMLL